MFLKGYFSNRWNLAKRGDSLRELLSIKNRNLLSKFFEKFSIVRGNVSREWKRREVRVFTDIHEYFTRILRYHVTMWTEFEGGTNKTGTIKKMNHRTWGWKYIIYFAFNFCRNFKPVKILLEYVAWRDDGKKKKKKGRVTLFDRFSLSTFIKLIVSCWPAYHCPP